MCLNNDKPTVSTYCVPTACVIKNELRCDFWSQGMHSLERRYIYIYIKNGKLLKKKTHLLSTYYVPVTTW